MQSSNQVYKKTGFYRIHEIIGNRKTGAPGLLPIGRIAWWSGVASGKYPASIKLSARTTVWKAEDINSLIEKLGGSK